jgi:hypothetical protein
MNFLRTGIATAWRRHWLTMAILLVMATMPHAGFAQMGAGPDDANKLSFEALTASPSRGGGSDGGHIYQRRDWPVRQSYGRHSYVRRHAWHRAYRWHSYHGYRGHHSYHARHSWHRHASWAWHRYRRR